MAEIDRPRDSAFRDRAEAGQRLAQRLDSYRGTCPLVLGLARGGMIVAAEVAQRLGADLDVLVARKVGAPSNPEYGIGAVGPDGTRYFDERAVAGLGLSPAELATLAEREESELLRRLRAYRGARPMPEVADRTVILVDDGLATGVTAIVAVMALRRMRPARLVLAAPVGSRAAVELLEEHVDEVVCVETPDPFRSVGEFYVRFDQTSDEEVIQILQKRIGCVEPI